MKDQAARIGGGPRPPPPYATAPIDTVMVTYVFYFSRPFSIRGGGVNPKLEEACWEDITVSWLTHCLLPTVSSDSERESILTEYLLGFSRRQARVISHLSPGSIPNADGEVVLWNLERIHISSWSQSKFPQDNEQEIVKHFMIIVI